MKSLYLLINIFSVSVPFLFSFHPKLKFYREWKYFLPALLITSGAFIIWDQFFTDRGIWGFNEKYTLGIYIGSLPLEEILFFICIPYACVFTFHCFRLFFKFEWPEHWSRRFTSVLVVFLAVMAIIFYQNWYTFYTAVLLAAALSLIYILDKNYELNSIYSTWFFLLIPFLIVNGILTGTGLEEPVVWYNNDHNVGIRMLTIPLEDVFYGFLLFLGCVYLTDKFKSLFNSHS